MHFDSKTQIVRDAMLSENCKKCCNLDILTPAFPCPLVRSDPSPSYRSTHRPDPGLHFTELYSILVCFVSYCTEL